MAEVARLVGMEERDYMKDGQKRHYCGLHLVHVEDTVDDVLGSKVEVISCPQSVDPSKLKFGQLYELIYTIYQTKTGKGARLSGIAAVEG